MAKTTSPAKPDLTWNMLGGAPWASSRTDDIWFFNENEGWLVNSSGYVCSTSDGGNTWHQRYFVDPALPGRPYLRSMSWGSKKAGWFGSVTGLTDGEWYQDFDPHQNPLDRKHHTDYRLPKKFRNTLLFQTKDGGDNWQPVTNLPKSSPAGICGFHAVNPEVAYGSGTNDPGLPGPAVIKTTDGGAHWELIPLYDFADNLIDIYFFDEMNGFVVGGKEDGSCGGDSAYPPPRLSRYAKVKPVVLRTTDGGKSWKNMAGKDRTKGLFGGDYPCGEWGWKIQFLDKKTGFVALENFRDAAILKTTDGGETWTRKHVAPNQDPLTASINLDIEGIGFIDENRGWVGGWGHDFRGYLNSYTEDGGETWVAQNHNPYDADTDPRFRINRYRFVGSPPVGYCCGQTIFKMGGSGGGKKSTKDATKKAPRVEPHGHEYTGTTLPTSKVVARHDFHVAQSVNARGEVEISYTLPQESENVFVGLWNQFAFHVRTLVSDVKQRAGRQTLIWDGKDDAGKTLGDGLYILRMSTDGRTGGSQMVRLAKVAQGAAEPAGSLVGVS